MVMKYVMIAATLLALSAGACRAQQPRYSYPRPASSFSYGNHYSYGTVNGHPYQATNFSLGNNYSYGTVNGHPYTSFSRRR